MSDDADVDDLLSLVHRRRSYLTALSDGPKHKRDVIDALSDSRSTVDRATERLREAELVDRTDDGAWVTTRKGDLLLETVGGTRETVRTVSTASDIVEYLPRDEPVPAALFRDASVEIADGPTPLAIAERVRDTVAAAESIRGFAVADHGVGVKEDIVEATLTDESFAFDYVFDASLVDEQLATGEVPWSDLNERPNARIGVVDGLPFGLFLTDHGDETRLILVVYDDQNVVRGQIRTTNPEAVAWANDLFERYRAEATPLESWMG